MLNFPDAATVKKVVHSLPRVGVGTNFGLPQTRWDEQWNRHPVKMFHCVIFCKLQHIQHILGTLILSHRFLLQQLFLCILAFHTHVNGVAGHWNQISWKHRHAHSHPNWVLSVYVVWSANVSFLHCENGFHIIYILKRHKGHWKQWGKIKTRTKCCWNSFFFFFCFHSQ